jgi:hypothetical protein
LLPAATDDDFFANTINNSSSNSNNSSTKSTTTSSKTVSQPCKFRICDNTISREHLKSSCRVAKSMSLSTKSSVKRVSFSFTISRLETRSLFVTQLSAKVETESSNNGRSKLLAHYSNCKLSFHCTRSQAAAAVGMLISILTMTTTIRYVVNLCNFSSLVQYTNRISIFWRAQKNAAPSKKKSPYVGLAGPPIVFTLRFIFRCRAIRLKKVVVVVVVVIILFVVLLQTTIR